MSIHVNAYCYSLHLIMLINGNNEVVKEEVEDPYDNNTGASLQWKIGPTETLLSVASENLHTVKCQLLVCQKHIVL